MIVSIIICVSRNAGGLIKKVAIVMIYIFDKRKLKGSFFDV
jgi:hypothetical protein